MQPQILNVDILDDKQPHVLVQKYVYPDRTFQVFRKPTNSDEQFAVSPGIEIDRDIFWGVPIYFATGDEDDDDDLSEVFAAVYLDEENPPAYDREQLTQSDPYVNVVYDRDEGCFRGESTLIGYDEIDTVAAPTLSEAIDEVVSALYQALARRADEVNSNLAEAGASDAGA